MIRILFAAAIAAIAVSNEAPGQSPPRPSVGAAEGQQADPPLFRHATVNHAWAATQKTRRPMLVFVTSDHCIFCKKMLRETFAHPQIGRGVAGYSEPVVLDASESPELAKKLGIRAYPTTLVISYDNQLLHKVEGFVEPQEFAQRLWPVFRQAASARRVAARNAAVRGAPAADAVEARPTAASPQASPQQSPRQASDDTLDNLRQAILGDPGVRN
ncbi:MAG: thioredoxin family protein [Planctomycetales bacterium]|nr:thioredoxin family protein [Planctomycetales bacterium]